MSKLVELQQTIRGWASEISLSREPVNAVVKMVDETSELLDAVINGKDIPGEIADCFIILLDLADLYGIDPVEASLAKMDINKKRKWFSDNGVIRRARDEE